MLIKKRPSWFISENDVTPESVYMDRRKFIRNAGLLGLGTAFFPTLMAKSAHAQYVPQDLAGVVKSPFSTTEEPNSWEHITTYNNFYEFGTGKEDPVKNAKEFNPDPWKVKVTGLCENPGEYDIDDIVSPNQLEERIYRFRCVEAWSMIIPWVGFPLANLVERFKPTSDAKYIAFETLYDPDRMPGQKFNTIPWPYREGLRLDEAMHPLTIMGVGLYGKQLPAQNGAPFRLVVPWKYGFKSIKSIVGIHFVKDEPPTTWNISAPREYGFYANVNPEVNHPRWSQARERRVGKFLRQPTAMFNGYGEEVASLYDGMDLRKFF